MKLYQELFDGTLLSGLLTSPIGETPTLRQASLNTGQLRMKRVFDFAAVVLILAFILPLLILISLAIKTTSRGPLIFRQPRVGYRGRVFICWKFRTMFHDQSDLLAARQTARGDPRVTPVGRWLRRYSFDELPQLVNVLMGDMSLVGPRPHTQHTSAGGRPLRDIVAHYDKRHVVRPGITGLAQISGYRGPIETADHIRRRVELDMFYIQNWSLKLDLTIILMTCLREIYQGSGY